MFRASTLLILICLQLTVTEGRYNSKRTRFIKARNEDPPLRRLMIINNEKYKLSDQHRNRIWDLYRTKMGNMNTADVNQAEGGVRDLRITQADGRRGLQVHFGSDPSSRLGLASPVSGNSFVWTPIMTPRKAPSAEDPSINEIDSTDYFPSNNDNISTTTEKPNVVLGVMGNNSGIVPVPNNRDGGYEVEWLTSTTTTTSVPETRVIVPEHPTSLAEFFYAQLSLLVPMWTNITKLTDHFSREIMDTVSSVFDFLWEIFVLLFSDRKRRAIEYDVSDL